jgi:hypothetical protein
MCLRLSRENLFEKSRSSNFVCGKAVNKNDLKLHEIFPASQNFLLPRKALGSLSHKKFKKV